MQQLIIKPWRMPLVPEEIEKNQKYLKKLKLQKLSKKIAKTLDVKNILVQ